MTATIPAVAAAGYHSSMTAHDRCRIRQSSLGLIVTAVF
jgi:hypothetical protein